MNINKSLRIIFRNKIYSQLNIAGLTIGITAAALIFLWVESKVNFNRVIANAPNLYIAGTHGEMASGEITTGFSTSNPLNKALEEIPEVKRSSRYRAQSLAFTLENTTTPFEEEGAYADPALLDMIGVTLMSGSFNSQNIIISQSLAKKLYGTEDPIGKGWLTEDRLYEISGVFKDMPGNTAFEFEWLIPFDIHAQDMAKYLIIDEWGTSWMATYVELEPNTDLRQLNEKLGVLPFQKAGPMYEGTHTFLYPINRILLYNDFKDGVETGGGYIKTVRLFFLIGVLILLIACINFINLSTARSQKRAMEVGVRKTFGTKRKFLIGQFIIESGLITAIALLLSIVLIWMVLPLFNKLIDTQLSFDFTNPYIVAGLIAIGLFCTFAAGSYPALYLSSFNPVTTLKMQKTSKGGLAFWIRQGLVIFQFTIAFILICTTFVIYLQIRLAQNRDTGIEKENLVIFGVTKELSGSYAAVMNELQNTGLVATSGFSSSILLYPGLRSNPWHWNGKDPADDRMIAGDRISEGLIEAAGIKLIEGTDLNAVKGENEKVLINETQAKRMGEEGRIGGKLWQRPERKYEIVGIVKNFIIDDPYALEPEPMMFRYDPQRANLLFIRLKPDTDMLKAIGVFQSVLQTFTPHHTFDPILMTDRFKNMFAQDSLIEKLAALFAILAIFISCLGLLGLSAYSAEQRTKEIGVRKVLGAKMTDILLLLGKAYIALLLVSFVIGIPVALYVTNHYLEDYAYRIVLSWDIFVGVAFFIAFIALSTVSFQSVRAAVANPVKSIKTE